VTIAYKVTICKCVCVHIHIIFTTARISSKYKEKLICSHSKNRQLNIFTVFVYTTFLTFHSVYTFQIFFPFKLRCVLNIINHDNNDSIKIFITVIKNNTATLLCLHCFYTGCILTGKLMLFSKRGDIASLRH
jgi:hypothetical protein